MKKFWIFVLCVTLFSSLSASAKDSSEVLSDSLPDFRVITAKEGEVLEPPNPPWRLIGSIITFYAENKTEWSCMITGCKSWIWQRTHITIYYFNEMERNGRKTKSIQFQKATNSRWVLNFEGTFVYTPYSEEIHIKSIATW